MRDGVRALPPNFSKKKELNNWISERLEVLAVERDDWIDLKEIRDSEKQEESLCEGSENVSILHSSISITLATSITYVGILKEKDVHTAKVASFCTSNKILSKKKDIPKDVSFTSQRGSQLHA
jgi:hypothetical protein